MYVTAKRDVAYTEVPVVDSDKIYKVVAENKDGVTIKDNKGYDYFLPNNNINGLYKSYSRAVFFRNLPLVGLGLIILFVLTLITIKH